MDESNFGQEDKRGYWVPNKRIEYPPVFVWPPQLVGFLKWIPKYIFPWSISYALLAIVVWAYLTPSLERLKTFSADWIGLVFLRNVALTILVVGTWHFWLYMRRAQGTAFKFNRRWPAEKSPAFLFNNQTKDNMFWTFASGVPIWTAWEVVSLWLYANGFIGGLTFADNPVWFIALLLLLPLLHEFHFFCVHRLLHWPPLYRRVHKLHHLNTNPGPWSGMAMHPVEHLIYFSGFLIYWIVPSHPIHALNLGLMAGLAPAQGHTGFDRLVLGDKACIKLPYYAHYLHHRLFEVNYADGNIPLDKWFGSFHDGSPEADEALKLRRMKRSKPAKR